MEAKKADATEGQAVKCIGGGAKSTATGDLRLHEPRYRRRVGPKLGVPEDIDCAGLPHGPAWRPRGRDGRAGGQVHRGGAKSTPPSGDHLRRHERVSPARGTQTGRPRRSTSRCAARPVMEARKRTREGQAVKVRRWRGNICYTGGNRGTTLDPDIAGSVGPHLRPE
jgi:hypothetical protein